MERTNRAVTSRKNRTNARNARGMYVDGNAVRRLQEVPARPYQAPGAQTARRVRENMPERPAAQPRQLSREAQRNREKAQNMGRGLVIFLAVVKILWQIEMASHFIAIVILKTDILHVDGFIDLKYTCIIIQLTDRRTLHLRSLCQITCRYCCLYISIAR